MKILWLDDKRDPTTFCTRMGDITWAKSYKDFTTHIIRYGVPDYISFDHDLGKATEEALRWMGYSKKEARQRKGEELTGYDCAKWLVKYCDDNKLDLPEYDIHSSNPVGKVNIKSYIENARKHLFTI